MRKVFGLICLTFIFAVLFSGLPAKAQDFDSRCWTETQCKAEFERRIAEDGGNSTWDASKYFKINTEYCPVQHGFCYPPNLEIDLLIPLGETRSVAGLGDYIQALYRVLIAFISLIIVVSLMVAGLIWMTARGDSGTIKKATDLAGKSFFSLLIVLFSVTLLQLIDPELINLNPLRTPLVKQINYIDSSVSCEALIDSYGTSGLRVNPGSGNCGVKGKVDLSQFDESKGVVGLEDGAECIFSGSKTDCKDFKSCVQDSEGDYKCVSCGQALDNTGLSASSSLCSSFGASATLAPGEFYECRYIPPNGLVSGFIETLNIKNTSFCLEIHNGTEARPTINCQAMKRDASNSNLSDGCQVYQGLKLNSTATWTGAGTWKGELGNFAKGGGSGADILGEFCNNDICEVSTNGCMVQTRPVVVNGAFVSSETRCVRTGTPEWEAVNPATDPNQPRRPLF